MSTEIQDVTKKKWYRRKKKIIIKETMNERGNTKGKPNLRRLQRYEFELCQALHPIVHSFSDRTTTDHTKHTRHQDCPSRSRCEGPQTSTEHGQTTCDRWRSESTGQGRHCRTDDDCSSDLRPTRHIAFPFRFLLSLCETLSRVTERIDSTIREKQNEWKNE